MAPIDAKAPIGTLVRLTRRLTCGPIEGSRRIWPDCADEHGLQSVGWINAF
jgi:hypothetical protein